MSDDAAIDDTVRTSIADTIRSRGHIPTIDDVGRGLSMDRLKVEASFTRLAAARVHIARRGSNEILAFNPFCADETDFRVRSAGREWSAICGWDALGIPPALGATGDIETTCADCSARLSVEVTPDGARSPDPVALLVGVPARDFWKDIHFT